MPAPHLEFDVAMSCGGCSGAIERVLKKMNAENTGVSTYNANLETQKVNVDLDADSKVHYDEVYEKIKKTGKKISVGKEFDAEGNLVKHVEYDGEGNASVKV